MDNQHKLIKGYRDLSQDEIDLMNEVKELAAKVGELTEKLLTVSNQTAGNTIDMRWVNIGKTDLQKGFMSLVRSIAKPESF
jgi:hypothetical protein